MYRTDIPEERVLRKAEKRVKAKKGFFAHFVTYLSVIGFLFMINMMTSPGFSWWLFPAGGWAIGVVAHYFSVFGILGLGSRKWEERQLAREIDRIEEEEEDFFYQDEDEGLSDDSLELKNPESMKKTLEDRDLV